MDRCVVCNSIAAGDVIAGIQQPADARHDHVEIGGHAALVYLNATRATQRVQAWTDEHLHRGYQVIRKDARRNPTLPDPPEVEHINAVDLYHATGGRPAALLDWHHALLDHALATGYAGVAVSCDGPALRVIAPDPTAMLAHERDLTALTALAPLSVLCRYDVQEGNTAQLTELIRAHSPVVDDVSFSARRHYGQLSLTGEFDMSNAIRLGAVLDAALAEGIRVVDIAGVTFLSAGALRILAQAGDTLAATGDVLILNSPTPMVQRIITLLRLTASGSVTVADRQRPP